MMNSYEENVIEMIKNMSDEEYFLSSCEQKKEGLMNDRSTIFQIACDAQKKVEEYHSDFEDAIEEAVRTFLGLPEKEHDLVDLENALAFRINNGRTAILVQEEYDKEVMYITGKNYSIYCGEGSRKVCFQPEEDSVHIPAKDMVQLIQLYKHVKRNDIYNHFINPSGKNRN